MGRVTRRSVASKDESTPKESPKSAGKRGAKKEESAIDKAAGGDTQETPTRRSGRQPAKEGPKADGPARGKSASRGRSASRGGKAKKEEEPESKEKSEDEEVEEKLPKGGSRSRSRGKAGQEVKATNAVKGGRGTKTKDKSEKDEENVEEEGETVKETEEDEPAVKGRGGRARSKTTAAAVAPSPRTERKGRGKAATAEQESDEKGDDSVKSKKDEAEASTAADNETDATPKGRQRRGANKDSVDTPTSSSGRRGRGQKAESAPPVKTTPASGKSTRRRGAAEAVADETVEKTEEMETGEEEKATPAEGAVEKKAASTTDEATTEKEEHNTEKAITEKDKKAASENEAPTTEEAAMETQESSATEKAAYKEQTATEKAAVDASNTAAVEASEPVSPAKKRKLEDDETEPSELESPNKKRKLEGSDGSPVAKRVKADTTAPAEVSTEEDFIVVNKEDVPSPDSKEVLASLPPQVKEGSSDPPGSEDITDEPAAETVAARTVSLSDIDISGLKDDDETAVMETSIKPPTDDFGVSSGGPAISADSGAAEQVSGATEKVKLSSDDTNASQDGALVQDTVTPTAAAEPASAHANSTSEAAPVVPQDTLAAPQTFPAVDSSQPEAMEVDGEVSLGKTASNFTDHSAVHQNGTDEEPSIVNSDTHLTSSPDKVQAAVRKDYVPSSTAIDSRKFILNPTFPVEMMDPAYCFSVVSYNILADCHLCRGDYSYTQPQYLAPEFRHNLLLKELDYLDGDIVCLQEVSPKFYNDALLPAMKSKGYEGHLIKRTKEYWDEGEATFVKTSKFDLVSNESASLADLAFKKVESCGLSAEVTSAAKKYLDRADVILLTELRCKKTGKTLTVCNIHVVYDPKAPDVQCIQVALAVNQLVTKAGSDQNPHIICGDFNADASSPAYQLARDGYLSDDHIRKLQALQALSNTDGSSQALIHHLWAAFQHTSSTLKNAYEQTLGKEPPVTVYTKEGRSADHIFFSSASIDNVGVLETLDLEVLQASGGLPSKSIPSDHVSIKAGFRLK
ncbi:unnamed protein product [Candidula unifasciata]|uniref:Endonuclease/exonuclease/phosphatase domain-containing protein n=1 Tax=Candidula unifasciata TaxID=100452 RepID=A0A8S3YDM3_9EUPU|nr:unnamed protein product [Candidula unifasciata]